MGVEILDGDTLCIRCNERPVMVVKGGALDGKVGKICCVCFVRAIDELIAEVDKAEKKEKARVFYWRNVGNHGNLRVEVWELAGVHHTFKRHIRYFRTLELMQVSRYKDATPREM